jgi:hypothetical protein
MVARTHPEVPRAWSIGFVAAVGGVVAVYFFLRLAAQNVVFDGVAVATAGAMFVGVVANRAEPRFAWTLLASGTLLMALGDIVFGTSQPVPSVADMLYVGAYVALTLGFIGLIKSEFQARREPSRLDAVILAAGVAITGILLLIVPAAHPDGAGLAAQAVSLGYPSIDLILLAVVFRLAHRDTARRTVFLLLGAGLLLRLVADGGYALSNFGTTYVAGDPADAFWLLSYACFGAALLHPALARARMEVSATGTPRLEHAPDKDLHLYVRAASIVQSQAIGFQAILALAGGILLVLAGGTLLLAVAWKAPEILLVSGAYGGSGMLILIASAMAQ